MEEGNVFNNTVFEGEFKNKYSAKCFEDWSTFVCIVLFDTWPPNPDLTPHWKHLKNVRRQKNKVWCSIILLYTYQQHLVVLANCWIILRHKLSMKPAMSQFNWWPCDLYDSDIWENSTPSSIAHLKGTNLKVKVGNFPSMEVVHALQDLFDELSGLLLAQRLLLGQKVKQLSPGDPATQTLIIYLHYCHYTLIYSCIFFYLLLY